MYLNSVFTATAATGLHEPAWQCGMAFVFVLRHLTVLQSGGGGLPCAFRWLSTKDLAVKEKFWQVSNYGRCRSTLGSISWGHLQPCGYRIVGILRHNFLVHRLVAFLGPPPSELAWQVNHRDGNPSNNCLENLEYVTPSENVRHSFADLSRRNAGESSSQPVMWRPIGSQSWTTSPSMTQAAAEVNISTQSVSSACRQSKPVKGFEFKLAKRKNIPVLEGEEWRQMYDPVSGAEVARRKVSSLGRITAQNGRISWGYQRTDGYCHTQLRLSSLKRSESIHRLVAFAFIGAPVNPQQIYVNHKDMDKGNNSVQNLEYVTPAENIAHRYANGCTTPRQDVKPVESRPFGSTDDWDWHPSISSAGSALRVTKGNISSCHHDRKHAGGFEFRLARVEDKEMYADEEWRRVDVEAHLSDRASRQNNVGGGSTGHSFRSFLFQVFDIFFWYT